MKSLAKKILFIFLMCSASIISLHAQEDTPIDSRSRYRELLRLISAEIEEVEKLDKLAKGKDPDLKIRLANSYLEQSRLLREEENFEYLSFNSKNRNKINKTNFFKNSSRKLAQAKSLALNTVKQFPSYRKRVEVYYILAYYEREYNHKTAAEKLLKQAEKNLSFQPELTQKVYCSIAEMAFVDKDYKKARNYYSKVINNRSESWWTKDAYNLGWSYYETGNPRESINLMKQSFKYSSNGKYIDMRSQVNQALALIYAQTGNLSEGVAFYKSQGPGIEDQLIELSKNLKLNGKIKESTSLLNTTYELAIDTKMKAKVLCEKIKTEDETRNQEAHLRDIKTLSEMYLENALDSDQSTFLKNQIQKQVALLQKNQQLNVRKNENKPDKKNSYYIGQYTDIWSSVDKSKEAEAKLMQGDSQLISNNGPAAFGKYRESFELLKNSQKPKLKLIAAQGLIRSLDLLSPKSNDYDQNYIYTFNSYISLKKKDKETQEAYRRLFKYYYDNGDTTNMKLLLDSYKSQFPYESTTQEKMVSSLVVTYQKQKKDPELLALLGQIKNNDYAISPKYRKSLGDVEQKFEFKKVETFIDKGDTDSAAKGYYSLYQDKKSGKNSKAFAAYNLMTLSFKKNYLQSTYDWGVKALGDMSDDDVGKYRNEFLSVAYFLSDRFQFNAAADFSTRVLSNICNHNDQNIKNYLYLNILKNSMAMGRENFQSLFSLAEKCSIKESVINNSNREILFYLKDEKFNDSLAKFVNRMRKEKKQLDVLPEFACHLSHFYRTNGQNSASRNWLGQCKDLIATAQKSRTQLSKKSLDASVQDEIYDLRSSLKKLRSIRLSFPEATFKQILTKKLKMLDDINTQSIKLQKIGSPEGIYQSFDVLYLAYSEVSKEIEEFIPSGVNEDYKKSFRNSMAKIAAPLRLKSIQIFKQGRKILEDQNILVKGNTESAFHITLEEEVNYMGDFN